MFNSNSNTDSFDTTPPTPERMNQNGGVKIIKTFNGSTIETRYRTAWEHPLDAYFDLKAINKAEYQAGLKFQRAYYGAALYRNLDLFPTSEEQSELEIAWQDVMLKQAYKELPKVALDTVVDVCGYAKPVKSLRALKALRIGLGHLALHWNMAAIDTCEHKPNKA